MDQKGTFQVNDVAADNEIPILILSFCRQPTHIQLGGKSFYLVVVRHLPPGPHFLDHQIPQVTLRLKVGLKRLLPLAALDLQSRDSQQEERRRGDSHILQEKKTQQKSIIENPRKLESKICDFRAQLMADSLAHLDVPELGDLDVTKPAFRQQEDPLLRQGDLAHAVAGFD